MELFHARSLFSIKRWMLRKMTAGSDGGSGLTKTAETISFPSDFTYHNVTWFQKYFRILFSWTYQSWSPGMRREDRKTLCDGNCHCGWLFPHQHCPYSLSPFCLFVKQPGSLGISLGHTFSYWKCWHEVAFRNLDFPVSQMKFEHECGIWPCLDSIGCLAIKNG